jgi:hypothetical protein
MIKQLSAEDAQKYHQFYYPEEHFDNKAHDSVLDAICVAIGCIKFE